MLRIAFIAALVLAPAALADGGPSPGVDQGGDGVVSSSGLVRYVALPGADSTVLEAIRTRDGHVLHWRAIPGGFGIPFVTYNGTTAGISRNGRTLVLGESSFTMPLRTVSTFQLSTRRRSATRRSRSTATSRSTPSRRMGTASI